MTEQLTTYRAKGKTIGLVFLFKYDLNGNLKLFEIEEGELSDQQDWWLFTGYLSKDEVCDSTEDVLKKLKPRFPNKEKVIKQVWMKHQDYIKHFEVQVSPADLSFAALWELYDYKVSKLDSFKAFNKLKQGDVIKCFIEVPHYLKSLNKNPGIGKLHLSTYIHKRRFDDERAPTISKNYNGVLHQLAKKKTDK